MRTEYYRAGDLAKVFRTQKIATMAELKDVLGSSADITIFRKLTELSSRTSYSHRGRFYTLADIPDYDAWGLWSYRSVWFSQRGTLLATRKRWSRGPTPASSWPSSRGSSTWKSRGRC